MSSFTTYYRGHLIAAADDYLGGGTCLSVDNMIFGRSGWLRSDASVRFMDRHGLMRRVSCRFTRAGTRCQVFVDRQLVAVVWPDAQGREVKRDGIFAAALLAAGVACLALIGDGILGLYATTFGLIRLIRAALGFLDVCSRSALAEAVGSPLSDRWLPLQVMADPRGWTARGEQHSFPAALRPQGREEAGDAEGARGANRP